MICDIKLTTRTKMGNLLRVPATVQYEKGRILFLKSPFALKDEIKAMRGSKWHGHDEDDGRKIWSIEDCPRNRFQLGYLAGEDVYHWFDRDLIRHQYRDYYKDGILVPPMLHQFDLADSGLTYHMQLWAAEMGTGKTLAAMMVIEHSGKKYWWWVGPASSLPNMKREFRKWGFDYASLGIRIELMTYEEMTRRVDAWKPGQDELPQGLILDESSRLKGATSQRSNAAQRLADMMRSAFNTEAYVIEMSGTPSPKSPVDWWSQTEIAWPGFLKEGSPKALEQRLAFIVKQEFDSGVFPKRIGWKDNEGKCNVCGDFYEKGPHQLDGETDPSDFHDFVASKNEVAYMYERLAGLVVIKHKKDCLTLPDKRYRKIICRPHPSTLRVAQAIADSAENAVTGLTLLRELSDGFQYRDIEEGTIACNHCPDSSGIVEEWYDPRDEEQSYSSVEFLDPDFSQHLQKRMTNCPRCGGDRVVAKHVRITKEVNCPKDKALKMLLEECEETGRIVVFAGFTGSVDRVTRICREEGWAVVRCDGRGFEVSVKEGKDGVKVIASGGDAALDYWADKENNPRVAFVAHPESGGMSLTLVEARMAVYWSNSFKPEYRTQSEDRIHRKGMDENLGCEIVDIIHLPTDARVLEVIQGNRKLELMTMGEFKDSLDTDGDTKESIVVEELVACQ